MVVSGRNGNGNGSGSGRNGSGSDNVFLLNNTQHGRTSNADMDMENEAPPPNETPSCHEKCLRSTSDA